MPPRTIRTILLIGSALQGTALALYFAFYNFVRIHKTLRVTPAMAAGLSKTVLDWSDIIGMMDAEEVVPKRGPYKKTAEDFKL